MVNPDEGAFSSFPIRSSLIIANGGPNTNSIIKTGPGFLKSITFSQSDAAPTAGTFTVYDSVSAYGTGASAIFSHTQTTGVFMPVTVTINKHFSTGLSAGVTGIGDVLFNLQWKG